METYVDNTFYLGIDAEGFEIHSTGVRRASNDDGSCFTARELARQRAEDEEQGAFITDPRYDVSPAEAQARETSVARYEGSAASAGGGYATGGLVRPTKAEAAPNRIVDTRLDDPTPAFYCWMGSGEYREFKPGGFSGSPASGYCEILTIVESRDAFGGVVKQTLTDSTGKVFTRAPTNEATWGPWKQKSVCTADKMIEGVRDAIAFARGDETRGRVAYPDGNPKTLMGAKKPDLSVIPPVALLHLATAMMNGAEKYGPFNWRDQPISYRPYLAAALRHVLACLDGEDFSADTVETGLPVHHLAHVMACCAIALDAVHQGTINDNRPGVAGSTGEAIERYNRDKRLLPA